MKLTCALFVLLAVATGPINHEHYGEAAAAGPINHAYYGEAAAAGPINHEYNGEAAAAGGAHTIKKLDEQTEGAFIRFFSPKSCITLPGEEKCKDVQGENNQGYDIKVTYNEKEEYIKRGDNRCVNLNINDGSPPSKDGPSNIFINLSFVPNIPEEVINDFYSIIKKLKHMFEIVEPQENSVQPERIGGGTESA
ncbi:hypothetical protein PCYB_073880 [Plasmodium cynomolgi strain B]|uniref:Uncharacterized protein n=1 Tax=Plasmodium cynomolgi (strain B) TaxID=1120755 RepID=K6UD30_PLACD|nr:hypothetical protein PCYB_073880 [Plasmodium cynomolgi strain B]GAB65886.1 hypothetical protein PCYB_073880 [Plasmodium cynomolgi strain B]